MRTRTVISALALALASIPSMAAPPAPPAPAAAPAAPAATAPAIVHPSTDNVVVDPATEDVIKGALKYLAAKQLPNGSWTSPNGEHPVAVTAYTIMAFLAAGNLPNEGDYGKTVTAGTNFLLSCVRPDGYITSEGINAGRKQSNMYDHGIATICLGEIYGQTQDPNIKTKLIQSIKLITTCQNREGGWRYTPRPESADISVTVLQVVALRAAKNAGLDVPQKTIDMAVQYVKSCHDNSGGFCYQPHQGPGFARTAAAIYSLQVCGLYDDPWVADGSKFLAQRLPHDREWFTYGNFYAAPAQYMIGGETWKNWYTTIRPMLIEKLAPNPGDKTIAYWTAIDGNAQQVGPVYATAVYTMILAMPYHYVPLYQR